MRRFRWRLVFLTIFVVFISATLAMSISSMISSFLYTHLRVQNLWWFQLTLKEILTPVITVCVALFFIGFFSRQLAMPLEALSRATREIAAGNFDIRLRGTNRPDEFGRLAGDFNTMALQLKANEYLRKDFVSNVSHEFKTPLAVIKGYAQLLEGSGLTPEEQREYARTIAQETDRLLTLSSTLLSLSRLETQKIRETPTTFALDEQIRQVVLELAGDWDRKNIQMDIDLQNVEYTGNEELLKQVWINLLGNAIKFSNEGGTIYVRLTNAPGKAIAEICDQGIGMTPETLTRLFEQFFQGDTSHKADGNGLGLCLVKRILDVHEAQIDVSSELNEGSTFLITLPVNSQKTSEPAASTHQ